MQPPASYQLKNLWNPILVKNHADIVWAEELGSQNVVSVSLTLAESATRPKQAQCVFPTQSPLFPDIILPDQKLLYITVDRHHVTHAPGIDLEVEIGSKGQPWWSQQSLDWIYAKNLNSYGIEISGFNAVWHAEHLSAILIQTAFSQWALGKLIFSSFEADVFFPKSLLSSVVSITINPRHYERKRLISNCLSERFSICSLS